MPYLMNRARKEFYEDFFNSKLTIVVNDAVMIAMENWRPHAHSKIKINDQVQLSGYITAWINHVQYMMIGQDEETKFYIANFVADKLIELLKVIFHHLYPHEAEKDQAEYWEHVSHAISDCISLDFDAEKVKNFVETRELIDCLFNQRHPCVNILFIRILHSLTAEFKLTPSEKEVVSENCKSSSRNIRQEYAKWTEYNFPYGASTLLAGISAGAWYFGMPYMAGAIAALDVAGAGFFAWAKSKLTKKAEVFFVNEAIKAKFGRVKNITIRIQDKSSWVEMGVLHFYRKLCESHKFTKKIITNSDKQAREVYVSSYDFDYASIFDFTETHLTDTQRKKNKPKKPEVQSKSFKTIDIESDLRKTKPRKVEVPEDFKGKIIEADNHVLAAILPPPNNSKIADDETDNMMGPRGDIFARSHGQSGYKFFRGCLEAKDKNNGKRILLPKEGRVMIKVNGTPQNVDAYLPPKHVVFK